MTRLNHTHVEVYLFRRRGRRVEFLVLKRSLDRRVLPGVWQPVTGKKNFRESAARAAAREVLEETDLEPRRWWMLEHLTLYFDGATGSIKVLPLFVAEVGPRERPTLSSEHDDYRFVSAREAARRFLWESQRRALDAIEREILAGGPHARAIELSGATHPNRGRRRQPRTGS
jgi:8-oxo-dGTP pyrophosphatase MutT (NUDIX family)